MKWLSFLLFKCKVWPSWILDFSVPSMNSGLFGEGHTSWSRVSLLARLLSDMVLLVLHFGVFCFLDACVGGGHMHSTGDGTQGCSFFETGFTKSLRLASNVWSPDLAFQITGIRGMHPASWCLLSSHSCYLVIYLPFSPCPTGLAKGAQDDSLEPGGLSRRNWLNLDIPKFSDFYFSIFFPINVAI